MSLLDCKLVKLFTCHYFYEVLLNNRKRLVEVVMVVIGLYKGPLVTKLFKRPWCVPSLQTLELLLSLIGPTAFMCVTFITRQANTRIKPDCSVQRS